MFLLLIHTDNSRLRLDDDSAGLGPPLQEDHVLSTAGIVQGSKVVIEPGPIPLLSEVRSSVSTSLIKMAAQSM